MPTSLPLSQAERREPAVLSLPARMAGVVRAPRTTFAAVAEAPRWAGVLAATFLITFLCSAALLETETGRLALIDQWERTAFAFGQPVDDALYASFEQASRNGTLYAAVSAVASGPLLAVVLSAILFAIFTGMQRGGATYRQVLAVVAHAGVILALRQVVAAPLNYARETLASPTTSAVFFRGLDETSPLARFFGALDLFVLWWICALALGISVLYRRRARSCVAGFIGAYVALALVLTAIMALAGGTA